VNSTAILLLIAGVLSVEGEVARIDAGRAAGLRTGDRGVVFYQLKVRDESRRVEVGSAEVLSVADETASIELTAPDQVRSGYRVEFSIPADRLAQPPPTPTPRQASPEEEDLRRRLRAAEGRAADLESEARSATERVAELEGSLARSEGQSRSATGRVAELERALADAETRLRTSTQRTEERQRSVSDLEEKARAATERAAELEGLLAEARSTSRASEERAAAAESSTSESASSLSEIRAQLDEALEEQDRLRSENRASAAAAEGRIALLAAELETARAALPKTDAATSDREEAAPSSATGEARPEDAQSMTHLAGGEYSVGREAGQASYYNQTPRFSVSLAPFWVDLRPVEASAYEGWRGSAPVAASDRYQAGVTLAEAKAYCRSHGKRLPTEVEWEVAVTVGQLEGVPSLLEWTDSWYQPYPGNDHPEADYGERFRVVRSSDGDRYERRYMLPQARDAAVGFRCVRSPTTE
jgi:formylglycine-generating enzyme required for sulfatase activity